MSPLLETRPPAADEVEVSLFGPGYGESVVIHLGGGRWMIVDSCQGRNTSEPAAALYLEELGVSADSVALIVATHWHDDHLRGMGALAERYPDAKIYVSALFDKEPFKQLAVHASRSQSTQSGMHEVLRILRSTKAGKRHQRLGLATADKVLLRLASPFATEVHSLSPSDRAMIRMMTHLTGLLPNSEGRQVGRLPNPGGNDASVVLHVAVGDVVVLLGADLEERRLNAWTAVANSTTRPQSPASLIKVPHHGSKTAWSSRLWKDLLTPDPVAMCAPFRNGALRIPDRSEVQYLRRQAGRAYLTSEAEASTTAKGPWPPVVEKAIIDAVSDFGDAQPALGQVRARRHIDGGQDWTVELSARAASI